MLGQTWGNELKDMFRVYQVTKTMLPQVEQAGAGGETIAPQLFRSLGKDDLPTMADRQQASNPVQAAADIVAILDFGCSSMKG
jgi:hypothetical protein